jgi:putative peptidoglycan lipid II flippase
MSANAVQGTPVDKGGSSTLKQILVSLFTVGICWVFVRFGSLLVTMAIAHTWSSDDPRVSAYAFMFRVVIMQFIYPSVLNIFRPAFIPLYNEIRRQDGEVAAMTFAKGMLEIGMLLGCAVFAWLWLVPGWTLDMLASGFNAEQRAASITMMRQMAPGVLFLLFAEMYLILFHAERKFAYPHSAEAVQKIGWGLGVVVLGRVLGLEDIAVGVSYAVACVAQAVLCAIGMRRTFGWTVPFTQLGRWWGLWGRRTLFLMGPLVVGILAARMRDIVQFRLQSELESVSFVSVEYARQLTNLPVAFLGTLVSLVMLPHLAAILHSEGGEDEHRRTLEGTVTTLWLLSIPVVCTCLASAEELMALLYLKPDWGEAERLTCQQGALAVRVISLGFTFVVLENILMPGLFSIKSMWWPTLWGVAASLFQILVLAGLAVLGLPRNSLWLIAGVAFAFPLSRLLKNGVLMFVLRRKTGMFAGRALAVFLARVATITLAALAAQIVAAWLVRRGFGGMPHGRSFMVYKLLLGLEIVLPAGVMGIAFLALTWFGGYREQMLDVVRSLRAGRKGRAQVDLPEEA